MSQRFIELLRSTARPGNENLIIALQNGGFFTSPASTQHHLCSPAGLASHSLNVYDVAIKANSHCTKDEIIIAALLHDVGKVGFRGKALYVNNISKNQKVSATKPYIKNKMIIPMEHQDLSLAIVMQHIELTEDEMVAIKYHNGLYTSDGRDIKNKETALMLLIHYADMMASRIVED